MDRLELESFISNKMTIRQIGKEKNLSATSVRYWLKKWGLKTLYEPKNFRPLSECQFCGESDQTKFYRNQKARCKICHDKLNGQRMVKNKRLGVDLLGGKCLLCGYSSCMAALEFHHKDPSTKAENFDFVRCWGTEKLFEELEKCVLLCCRCHREVHAGVTALP